MKCPYCGHSNLFTEEGDENGDGFWTECADCGQTGPVVGGEKYAEAAFCLPEALLEGKVLVERELLMDAYITAKEALREFDLGDSGDLWLRSRDTLRDLLGMTCPACSGRGWSRDYIIAKRCAVCGGTGTVTS